MGKEPFVSGTYRPEDDASRQPQRSIAQIVSGAIKYKRRRFGPLRPPTEEEALSTRRRLGEKEE